MALKKQPYANFFSRWFKSPWPVILALIFTLIYFTLGEIIKLILPYTKYHWVPGFGADVAANKLRPEISWPISDWFDMKNVGKILVIPYYLVVGYLVAFVHLVLKPFYKYLLAAGLVVLIFLRIFPGTLLLFETNEPSISYGTESKGSIENARRLPYKHDGYITYSFLGYLAGRTFVHENVKATLVEAFKNLHEKYPERKFVVGDASTREGGPMAMQKDKENGLQVDFMLPLNDGNEAYDNLWITNYWNYGLDFDEKGKLGGMEVDYNTLASMLSALELAALNHDLTIKKIEMHAEVKRGLISKNLKTLLKNILGSNVKNDSKSAPAYFTVTFEIPSGKGRNLLQRIFKGKEAVD